MKFRFLDFEFDDDRLELRRGARIVSLQPKPLAVLLQLLRSSPGTVSREELLASVWDGEVVTDNSVSRAVRRLRLALETPSGGKPVLRTLRGRGYSLAVPVEVSTTGAAGARVPAEPPGAFVGRERELARVLRALDDTVRGAGRVVLIVGEAGIGKTRILQRFAGAAAARAVRVLWGACYEGAWSPPYAPFAEAISAYVGTVPPAQLRADVGYLGPALAEAVPGVRAALPGLPEARPLPPEAQRHRVLEAFAEAVLRIARRAPLLLVAEDLHWADAATLQLLRRLGRSAARGPILLACTYREEEIAAEHPLVDTLASLERETSCERIALGGLDGDEVAHLLRDLVGHDASRAVVEAVHAETDGNPFLVRELALHLREEGGFEKVRDARAIATLLEKLGAPQGLRHLIRRRLSNLSKDARLLVEAGAAFEGAFPLEVVRSVCGIPEPAVLDVLDEALDADLLRPTGPDAYVFSHVLVRRAIHTEASPSRRLRLHRRIAEAMEAWCSADRQRYAAELARQYYESAPLPGAERGVEHCAAAADQAQRAAAFAAMAEFLEMALELLPEDDARHAHLVARLALARAWNGEVDAAVTTARQAAAALARSEGSLAAADHLAQACQAVWWAGFGPAAWKLAPEGLRHLGERRDLTWARLMLFELWRREAADPEFPGMPQESPERREVSRVILDHWDALGSQEKNELFATALAFSSRAEVLGRAADVPVLLGFWAGEYHRARTLALEVAEESLQRGARTAAVLFLAAAARCELALGHLATADATHARAVDVASSVAPTPELATLLHAFRVDRALTLDEGAEEEARFMDAFFAAATPETRWIVANGMAFCAALHARTGHRDAALRLLPEVLEIVERVPGWTLGYTWTVHCAAETLWLLGRTEEVEQVERNLRRKTLAPDFRHPHTDARLSLARLCALTGRFDEASAHLDEARGVLDAQGARPLRAIADFDGALVCVRRGAAGDGARARSQLEAARRGFASLGMTGWLRRADALEHRLGTG
jgi:DNA-binding winged helix-turn-helix (wHTH) protein